MIEIWGASPAVFELLSGISWNGTSNGEPSDDKEKYENEITDHENEEGNIDDKNIDGLTTQTVNRYIYYYYYYYWSSTQ